MAVNTALTVNYRFSASGNSGAIYTVPANRKAVINVSVFIDGISAEVRLYRTTTPGAPLAVDQIHPKESLTSSKFGYVRKQITIAAGQSIVVNSTAAQVNVSINGIESDV